MVLFIDSDDYLMSDSLSYMMKAKEQYPDADVIIGNVYEHKYKKNQYNIKETITGLLLMSFWRTCFFFPLFP